MSKRRGIIIFCCAVYFSSITPILLVSSLSDGDCLGYGSFDVFRQSPGGYDSSMGMDGKLCASLCSDQSMPYAGVVGKKHCLCAFADDKQTVEAIEKVPNEWCDSSDDYTRYFEGRVIYPVTGLSIRPSVQQAKVGEQIEFEILMATGVDVEFSINYDDGTGPGEWNSNTLSKYKFYTPGRYMVAVYARQHNRFRRKIVSEYVWINIINEISDENVKFKCPEKVEPEQTALCNLTIIDGHDLEIAVNVGNNDDTSVYQIPDVPMRIIGPNIPQESNSKIDKGSLLKQEDILVIPIPESTLDTHTAIQAVEGFGATPGEMEVLVLRKGCKDGSDCSGSSIACYEPSVLCSLTKTCSDGCNNFPPSQSQYSIVKKFVLILAEGHFHLRANSSFRMLPGDLIAFRSKGGQLAYRSTKSNEIADYKVENAPEQFNTLSSDQIRELKGIKHYVRIIVSEPLVLALPFEFKENGVYRISVSVKNQGSSSAITRDRTIKVVSSLSKIRLNVNKPNAAVGEKVEVTIQLNRGSNINVRWDFGDGTFEEEYIPNVKTTLKSTKFHKFMTPGIYDITISAENVQGNSSATHTLIAQHPVLKHWKLLSDSPQLLPGNVKFTLSYPNDNTLPTNATAVLAFGDGKKSVWQIPESDWIGEQIVAHEYAKPGKYNVNLNISNIVTTIVRRIQVDVLRRIVGLHVSAAYLENPEKGIFLHGFGQNNSRFPINKQINFTMPIEKGDIEHYTIEINGKFLKNTNENVTSYVNSEPGFYNFTFYAYNHIQNLSDPYILPIYLMEPVEGMNIIDFSNNTVEPEVKRFLIEFDRIGTNSCLIINYGLRYELSEAYGDVNTCNELFDTSKFKWTANLTNPLEISRRYSKPREYIIRFNAANQISKQEYEITTNVIEIDCKPPIVSIRNNVNNWRKGTEFWKSKPVQLYSKTLVDCNATTEVTRVWDGYILDEENGTVIDRVDLSKLDSYRKSFLYVPPFFLKSGYYIFKFSINMTSPTPHPLLPFYASGYTYVKIVPSPIIPLLADGAQSRIIRGWGQRVRLAPGEFSRDPDNVKNKNFQITWYCRRLPDEYINRELPDERQNFSEPLYDRSHIDEDWDADDDGGGCFGKGPGRINITGGVVVWNTTVFRRAGLTYEIVIKITPPDRKPSWGALQLNLLKSSPPSIKVKCQTEPLCYPHDPIGQKINPVRVGLIGLCNEACDGELTYKWSIYGVDNGTEVLLQNASYYVVGADEPIMALGGDFFKEYDMFGDFFAKLAVTNEKGEKGESDIFLHINQPPDLGECYLKRDPPEGLALLDRFNVECRGWIDPENRPIEYYAFWARNLNNDIVTYLMYGPDKDTSLILPYGNFTLGVDIKDKEGALKRVNISDVTTHLPTKQQYDAFMQTKQLDNADAAGDQALMNMVSQALSSLMNVRLPIMDENGIITTTTTTTTMSSRLSNSTEGPTEQEIEEAAKTRAKMVKSVESIMNVDTLNSLEQIGSALTAIAGEGKGVDNEAKEIIVKLLNKTVKMASHIQVEAPQQLLDFCMFAVGTMGGIVNRVTEQLINRVVMPTDRVKALVNLDYNVEVPDEDDEPDYILDSKTSMDDALTKAVIESERKAAEIQIREMVQLTIDLVLAMLKHIVVGENPLEFSAPSGLQLTIAMYPKGSLSNRTILHGDSTYIFPDVCAILHDRDCFGNETLGTLAVSWPAILDSYGNSVDLLSQDSKTLQLLVLNASLNIIEVKNTTDTFSIIVPRKGSDDGQSLSDTTYVIPKIKMYEQMVYHRVLVSKADSAVNIEIAPSNPNSELLIFIKHNWKPMFDYYDLRIPLRIISSKNGTFDIFLSNEVINNRTGFFYVGIVEVNKTAIQLLNEEYILTEIIENKNLSSNYTYTETNETLPGITREFTTNYSMKIFTSGCYFFNRQRKIWSGEGCFVESANRAMTHCKCNHLTSFGSGFFIMPNSIDFTYVFANAGFADNVTIYMTIIVTMCIYVLMVIWARKEDRKDLTKIGATPLPDNDQLDKYLYEIIVFTGDKDGAATDSKVHFILSGDDDETEVRTFADPNRKIFRRGATDTFVLAVPRRLGRLNYCRIWHDNTGNGKFRSWLLSFIVVRDVQTGEKFEFICNKWLAVEKDDGSIDRLLPVAGRDEATEFSHLFQQTTQKNLADGHLWFSVFMRPPRSRFTRLQRVSCCMALLYLSMLVNAMWYERVPSKPSSSALDIGPFALSPEQIGVGFMSNLIVFPPMFLIIILFRKSRLRNLRPSRIHEALKKQGVRPSSAQSNGSGKFNKLTSSATLVTIEQEAKDTFEMTGKSNNKQNEKKKKKKKKMMFPWWCRYIAWALCILSMVISIFFLWAYGIQFGDEKTRKWVTSLIISFFASILVTQPIKVFVTAMILSTLFKSPDTDVDDSEEDEEELDIDLMPDEEWLHCVTPVRKKDRSRVYRPPNLNSLSKAKLQRLKELKMSTILKDIFSYLFFLWVLTVLSYGNRDPNAYFMKDTLLKTFIDGTDQGTNLMEVKTAEEFWKWSKSTLIPGLLIGDWYEIHHRF